MAEAIGPVDPKIRLAQLLGDDLLAQVPETTSAAAAEPAREVEFKGNIFEDVLAQAIESLNGVSRSETYANRMIDGYLRGEVELHEAMIAQSKMSIMVQLAVTTINAAVTSFKEITQMQI